MVALVINSLFGLNWTVFEPTGYFRANPQATMICSAILAQYSGANIICVATLRTTFVLV